MANRKEYSYQIKANKLSLIEKDFTTTDGLEYATYSSISDESDDIPVASYIQKALVYYVKARVAEDLMDLEKKEYFMREFRKMVEKHENAKVAGPRIIMSGNMAIR